MLPLKYNLRNLSVRWVTTLMTVLATAMVVWVSVLTFGMVEGLKYSLNVSGEPLDVLILRNGSDSEISSSVTESAAKEIEALSQVAKNAKDEPLCSAEYVSILTKPRRATLERST